MSVDTATYSFVHLLFAIFWTWLLNLICKSGFTPVSWFLVLFPIIIYFAITLLTENVDYKIDIIGNKQHVDAVMQKIGLVYKDVTKNAITLGDDYLCHGLERSNLDKTTERLDKMNESLSK